MSLRPAALLASPDPNEHGNGEMIPVARPRESGTHECTRKKQQGNYSTHTKQYTGFMRGSLCSAHSRGGVSPGRPESNWTCKWKWTIWDTNDEGVEEGESLLHQTTNQSAGPARERVHGGNFWRVSPAHKHKTTPWNSQKTHQTDPNHPPSGERVFVKQREREEERERGSVCMRQTQTELYCF